MVKRVIDRVLNEAVGTIQFRALKNIKDFGMVVLGAGGNPQEWADGIAGILKDEKIVVPSVETFSQVAIIKGNKLDYDERDLATSNDMGSLLLGDRGRTDLLLVFNHESKPHIGKLAMWRLRFGDISWVDDFIVNYAKDYK